MSDKPMTDDEFDDAMRRVDGLKFTERVALRVCRTARLAAESRLAEVEKERDRLREALTWIASTFTENSFGDMKCLPASEYQAAARAALAELAALDGETL